MPISVVCAGCKTRFEVSEKFAGKQGPCPKCKAVIKIPEVTEEVKIHVPDTFSSAGKDRTGRSISKPIPRRETKVQTGTIAAIIVGSVLALAIALAGSRLTGTAQYGLITVGLMLLGPPLAVAGYFFLRNDELESYQGKPLWARAAICGLAYAVLWGAYWYVKAQSGLLTGEAYQWVFIAPVFIAAGGGIALATLDLDYGSGALHYCFYLVVTLLLARCDWVSAPLGKCGFLT